MTIRYQTIIGVDEFLLHKNHQYATVVVDLETSEILFLEKGNKAQQLHNFFNKVGDKCMKHIKAIAMDMNAQYSNEVKDRYPDIDIVYDLFHIISNFNTRFISATRKLEQNRIQDEIERARKNMN